MNRARKQNPIGIFDSGVGGLSVWREMVRLLPHEATIYVADSGNCPYGPRPISEIQAMSADIVNFLLGQGCKLIVVACNTASAAALPWLRATYAVPFVGMEPAVKPAAQATRSGHVGVLATAGTLQGALFQQTAQRFAEGVQVHVRVGSGLVEQVEAGVAELTSATTEALLETHLQPLLAAQVDQIALGCTHYPLLLPLIEKIVAGRATIIDPAGAVVKQVERLLVRHHLVAERKSLASHECYTTGHLDILRQLVAHVGQGATVSVQALEINR